MRPTRYKSHFSCHVDRKYLSGLNLDRKYHVETIIGISLDWDV